MSTELFETCVEYSNKHIIEEIVCQVGHLPELDWKLVFNGHTAMLTGSL
jgi:hypothetical protein